MVGVGERPEPAPPAGLLRACAAFDVDEIDAATYRLRLIGILSNAHHHELEWLNNIILTRNIP